MAWVSKRKASDGSARYLANYRDPTGAKRSAGTFRSRPDAERAGHAAEIRIGEGAWVDRTAGKIRFTDYVETAWWPHLAHLELTTKAAYRSNLDAHFLPFFGRYPMAAITPPVVPDWVATAQRGGLSARSIRKYHTMLSSVFKTAHRDRVIGYNPCERTTLPKVITSHRETITPAQFEQLLAAIPERHRALLLVGIETGMRWGELAALRPRHLDVEHDRLTVQETIVEISKKNSPTGQRYTLKAYPKNDHRRTLKIGSELTGLLIDRIATLGLQDDDLLFPSTPRNLQQPTSRNTFRTKVWQPAVLSAGLPTTIRMHDLRHAHASWLLAGGADLKTVMDRFGHTQIATTQRYLHALDSADNTALEAFRRTRDSHLILEVRPDMDLKPQPPDYDGPSRWRPVLEATFEAEAVLGATSRTTVCAATAQAPSRLGTLADSPVLAVAETPPNSLRGDSPADRVVLSPQVDVEVAEVALPHVSWSESVANHILFARRGIPASRPVAQLMRTGGSNRRTSRASAPGPPGTHR